MRTMIFPDPSPLLARNLNRVEPRLRTGIGMDDKEAYFALEALLASPGWTLLLAHLAKRREQSVQRLIREEVDVQRELGKIEVCDDLVRTPQRLFDQLAVKNRE